MKKIRIIVVESFNVVIAYGSLVSIEPVIISFNNENIDLSKADAVITTSFNKEKAVNILKVREINEGSITFDIEYTISEHIYSNHFLEYINSFDVIPFKKEDTYKYIEKVRQINKNDLYSTKYKLQEIYSRDDVENRELISCLMDINSKLDEVLFLLRPKDNDENIIDTKSLFIGEEGLFIISGRELNGVELFIKSNIISSSGFFIFAVICDYKLVYKKDNMHYYFCRFKNIDRELEDRVMKFIFSKERELLKEINNIE